MSFQYRCLTLILLGALTACDGRPDQSEKPPANHESPVENNDPSEPDEPVAPPVTVDEDSPMLINTILEQDQT